MDVSIWEAMAAWYDAKQGDDGDLWHRTLIDPALLRVVGPVAGRRLLDLACGNGYLARRRGPRREHAGLPPAALVVRPDASDGRIRHHRV
ncbi:MAG TPA: hypothetical protein VGZ23_19695 [bacterium]|nr:hypothetical protein [bacterium]